MNHTHQEVIEMEQTNTPIEIVMQPVIYYEVSVCVRDDGTRITTTYPVDINSDGVETRRVPNGTTIIACIPPIYPVHTVYMIDVDGDKIRIGYDLPGCTVDWRHEAREQVESYEYVAKESDNERRLCSGGVVARTSINPR